VTGLTTRHIGEHFQQLNETIVKYFWKMITIFSSPPFYTKYISMPPHNKMHAKICNNTRFWPFFKDTIGVLDGSHIHAAPSLKDHRVFCNRK
ncbi:hypothetical protein HYDPIDRAFT_54044, partial [Hydnomerulius pinastri MD-312]